MPARDAAADPPQGTSYDVMLEAPSICSYTRAAAIITTDGGASHLPRIGSRLWPGAENLAVSGIVWSGASRPVTQFRDAVDCFVHQKPI